TGEPELRLPSSRRGGGARAREAGERGGAARQAGESASRPGGSGVIGGWRSLRRAALLLVLVACAQIEPPPGGPEDRSPPQLVMQRPDTLAVVPGWNRPVIFRFDERISEQQVEQSVMVSPRTSPVVVDRGSREIRVSLRRGWQPNTIYQVMVRPEIQDLFNNKIREPLQIVFSTGPEIPRTRFAGVVRDRITGEPTADARVEAIRTADSLVYAVPSDSTGRFEFAYVPEGEYMIRAYPDNNLNRSPDSFEPRDSLTATISVADTTAIEALVELSVVLPDSTPPKIASARLAGERRVEVRFDDYLDPAQELQPGSVTLTGPDSTSVAIDTVTIGEPPEEEAPDTAAAPAPGAEPAQPPAAAPDTAAAQPGAEPAPPPVAAPDTAAPDTAADTAGAAADTARVLPSQLLVIRLPEGVQL